MLQSFTDHYEDTVRLQGQVGPRFWLPVIADEIQNIVQQHAATLFGEHPFFKLTTGKAIIALLVLMPLYVIGFFALVRITLALPHPSVSGIGVIFAFALLLTLPGVLSAVVCYTFACALAFVIPKRGTLRA